MRRSTRVRKQSQPFWQQPLPSTKLTPNSSVDTNNNNTKSNQHLTQQRHRLEFPYFASPRLAQDLFSRLYQPDKFEKTLSYDHILFSQQQDELCQFLNKIVTTAPHTDSVTIYTVF